MTNPTLDNETAYTIIDPEHKRKSFRNNQGKYCVIVHDGTNFVFYREVRVPIRHACGGAIQRICEGQHYDDVLSEGLAWCDRNPELPVIDAPCDLRSLVLDRDGSILISRGTRFTWGDE